MRDRAVLFLYSEHLGLGLVVDDGLGHAGLVGGELLGAGFEASVACGGGRGAGR